MLLPFTLDHLFRLVQLLLVVPLLLGNRLFFLFLQRISYPLDVIGVIADLSEDTHPPVLVSCRGGCRMGCHHFRFQMEMESSTNPGQHYLFSSFCSIPHSQNHRHPEPPLRRDQPGTSIAIPRSKN